MPKFAANLSMLYPDLPFLDRFAAAAKDGFKGVEYLFPYAWSQHELLARLQDYGLQQVLFNAPPGGSGGSSGTGKDTAGFGAAWDAGMRGTACLADKKAEFQQGIEAALHYANILNCQNIHVMAGVINKDADKALARATYIENLYWAAERAAASRINILIEPINTRDIPGFYLNRQETAHEIVQEIGLDNVKVQMDLYHCQIVEGDVATKIAKYLPTQRVGHIQIAGVPERFEPNIGELNYPYLFSVIDEVSTKSGWSGWVGCEYRPARGMQPGGTSAGLIWKESLS